MRLRFKVEEQAFATLVEAVNHLACWYQISIYLPEIIDRCTGRPVPGYGPELVRRLMTIAEEAGAADGKMPIPTFTDADGVKHLGIPA